MDALTLESWIRRAREGTATPEELSEVFADAELVFPLSDHDPATGNGAPVVLEDEDGQNYAVVFSEPRRMLAFIDSPDTPEGTIEHHMLSTGSELALNWPHGLFILINPGTPELELVVDDVGVRAWGRVLADVVPAGSELVIGPPPEGVPTDLVAAVRAALAVTEGVVEAYVFGWSPDTEQATPDVTLAGGVVLEDGASESTVVPAFIQQVNALFADAPGMPWLPLSGDVLDAVREHVEPV